MRQFLIIVAMVIGNPAWMALAAIVHIPGDYPTFADAFPHAADGDTILVAPGTYEEHLSYLPNNLILSEAGPLNTKISGTIYASYSSVKLDGFTISGYKADRLAMVDFINTSGFVRNCIFSIDAAQVPETEPWRCLSLFDYLTDIEVSHCVFENKHFHQNGSGIYMLSLDSTQIHHCLFLDCNATACGGGIDIYQSVACSIQNNIFINNSAPFGSAIYYLGLWDGEIYNNIFINNSTSEENGCTVYETDRFDSSTDLSYNCFWNNIGGDYNSGEFLNDIGNITEDPLFLDIANRNFHLGDCSPCIDSGHPDSDFSNEPEPNGSRINMGIFGNTSEATSWGENYPTRTPTCTPEPTPSPSPTPYSCADTGVSIEIPHTSIAGGDTFYCTVHVCNQTGIPLIKFPLFVLLEIQNEYFFAPSFNQEFDHYLAAYPEFSAGETMVTVLEPFQWPEDAGSFDGARFIGALTDPGMNQIIGQSDSVEFGWH